MHLLSCLVLALATCIYALSSISVKGYKPAAFKAASPNVVTSNVLFLQRSTKFNKKGVSLRGVRAQGNGTFGTTNLTEGDSGQVFFAPITVGDQTFQVIVDTGSSDTWLVRTGFQCVNSSTNANVSESACDFGPTYTPSSTFRQIANENFNTDYGDGSFVAGIAGYDDVTLAGITVKDQEIGVVDYAGFAADGIESGLIGLAFPSLTSIYLGTNDSHDGVYNQVEYNPLFTNMYTKGGIPPIFSLAITRGTWGGTLAIGGLPNVAHESTFATSPFQLISAQAGTFGPIDNTTVIPQFQYYTITIQGYQVAGKYYGQQVGTFSYNVFGPPDDPETEQVIVDSGTTLNYVSDDVAQVTNLLFDPPAAYSAKDNVYYVDCDATPPQFGVDIGGQIFLTNRDDMIIDEGYGSCITGITNAGTDFIGILGDVFLKNVLAVFDVGASQMRFSARVNY